MTQIHESITARVPFAQILALADHYLKWLPRNHDGAAEIVLHAHVANLEIERDALLTIAPARVSPGLQVFSISWRDREDGPLPVFRGTLCAEEEDERFCRLDLDGGYAPPRAASRARHSTRCSVTRSPSMLPANCSQRSRQRLNNGRPSWLRPGSRTTPRRKFTPLRVRCLSGKRFDFACDSGQQVMHRCVCNP
jgi:hypothetical protein